MKNIFIERQESLLKVAIKQGDILRECFVEEETNSPKIGDIYKGVVKNIVPAMHCAFVDIGYEKNCYMSIEGKLHGNTPKKGDEVMVEIVKEELGKKGPKVTENISIPGTYVVLTNEHNRFEISRKIRTPNFKELIEENLLKPDELGVVIRTKAEGVDFTTLKAEVDELVDRYNEMHNKFIYSAKVGPLYKDNGILSRVMRNFTDGGANIVVDHLEDYNYYKDLIEKKKIANIQVELYEGTLSIFDNYLIEKEILVLRHNKINLTSGGNIVIDHTEAMTVVDVNTAKNTKSTTAENTILITNKEAAIEIVRQIRLRNLGGIILVDFVDMKSVEDKNQVIDILRKEFIDDKNSPKVYPFTELNLVQITRKKYGKSICDYVFKRCEQCRGRGQKISLEYLLNILKGKIRKIKDEQDIKNIYIELDSIYEKEIKNNVFEFALKLDALDCDIFIKFEERLYNFKIEPVVFHSQIETIEKLKVFSGKLKPS
ncbi:MAG: ribonuclease E/G [Clostridium sp.]|uniref:ribonuclease E/G n=1 Tax=Clostridium sp. TaxID=1506 RepID=UPI00304F763F